jgi:8-oxo-dGTP pyrophosphatase MutT (NUDIX family)
VPAASAVVALDGDDVILAHQARFAVDEVVLEIVKGGAEPGEAPLATAQRELREELGLVAARWDDLGLIYEVPSIVEQPIALFLARDVRAVPPEPEAVETIAPHRMPLASALLAAARGEIRDAATGLALLRAVQFLKDNADG